MLMNCYTKRLMAVLGVMLSFAATQSPFAQERLSPKQAVESIKSGGYTLYFRHFETGADTADQHMATLAKCASQRQLNAKGARQAIEVREAFVALKIPVGDVLASPFCRAWQSADLAFGRHTSIDGLKLPPSKDYTEADKRAMRDALLPLLAKVPAAGTNTVIMAHDDNMPAAGGPEIKTQGEVVIVKPDGKGGFIVVAQIRPGFWRRAARAN